MHGFMKGQVCSHTLNKMTCITAGAFCLFILISSAWLTFKNFLPLPFWDHWQEIAEFSKFKSGPWGLIDWFSQHNEHRIFIARLIMFADLKWTKGSGFLNIGAIWVFQAASALLLWKVIAPAANKSRVITFSFLFLCIACMFSLLQDENLQWQFQTQFAGVYTFAIAAVVALTQPNKHTKARISSTSIETETETSTILVIIYGMIASLCMANGLLIWPILITISVISKQRKNTLQILAAGITIWLAYLYDYQTPPYHSNPAESLLQIRSLFIYILNYLSIPFIGISKPIPILLACCGLTIVLSLSATLIIKKKPPSPPLLAMLSISYFIIGTATITALGRLKFGPEQAISSRYATPTLVFWVCIIGIIASITLDCKAKWANGITNLLVILFMGILSRDQIHKLDLKNGQYPGGAWLSTLPQAWTALATGSPDKQALSGVFMEPEYVTKASAFLKSQNYYPFRGADWSILGKSLEAIYTKTDPRNCIGKIEASISGTNEEAYTKLSGWAWDALRGKEPYIIVITDIKDVIYGIALPGAYRNDNPTKLRGVNDFFTGWHGHTSSTGSPRQVYAIIGDESQACLIDTRSIE